MSNDVLMELEDGRKEDSFTEEKEVIEQPKLFETAKMGEYLNVIRDELAGLETQDPEPERSAKVTKAVNNDIACYTLINGEKKG